MPDVVLAELVVAIVDVTVARLVLVTIVLTVNVNDVGAVAGGLPFTVIV